MTLPPEFSKHFLTCHNSRLAQKLLQNSTFKLVEITETYLIILREVYFCKKIHSEGGMEMESQGIEGC